MIRLFEIGYDLKSNRSHFTAYVLADDVDDAYQAIYDIIKQPFDIMSASIVCHTIHAISSKCRDSLALPVVLRQRQEFEKQIMELSQKQGCGDKCNCGKEEKVEEYVCEECNQTFTSKQLLGIHKFRAHGIKKGSTTPQE